MTDPDEIKHLVGCGHHGGDAVALLMLLRGEHQARIKRGETFDLIVKSMVEKETMPSWTHERFRNAIKTLLEAGYLKVVGESRNTRSGRLAVQYTLVPRQLAALQ